MDNGQPLELAADSSESSGIGLSTNNANRTFRSRSSFIPSRASVVALMNCSSSFSSFFSSLSTN